MRLVSDCSSVIPDGWVGCWAADKLSARGAARGLRVSLITDAIEQEALVREKMTCRLGLNCAGQLMRHAVQWALEQG